MWDRFLKMGSWGIVTYAAGLAAASVMIALAPPEGRFGAVAALIWLAAP